MAKRGTSKRYSQEQEAFVAKVFEGIQSKSSGAAVTDSGDVRCDAFLIECKTTGKPSEPAKSISLTTEVLHKIGEEALMEGKMPLVMLRIHNPDCILSDRDGNIDLVVHRWSDDLLKET